MNPSLIKKEIQDWFEKDRNFETGRQLYMRFGRNLSFKNYLNRTGQTADTYKHLCYELSKVAGLTESVYKALLQKPLSGKQETKADETVVIATDAQEIAKQLELINPSDLDYAILKSVVKELDLETKDQKKATLLKALLEAKGKKLAAIVPAEVKRGIKLREEFPFLKQKDCPDVLKVLVSDMLTAYNTYLSDHEKLMQATSEKEIANLSKGVVENYLENRQIWDELNYYKKNGKFLGKHPVFEWMQRKAEIGQMSPADLVKLRDQLKNKIPRTKKLIQDEPEHKENGKRQERVDQFEKELEEVNRLLELNK